MLVQKDAEHARALGNGSARSATRNDHEEHPSTEFKDGNFGGGSGGPLSDIHFGYNDYTISRKTVPSSARMRRWLQDHPSTNVQVEGNCDERGSEEYNIALGAKRAQSAKDYLVDAGHFAEPNLHHQLRQGIADLSRTDESCWQQNRRDHFVVSGNTGQSIGANKVRFSSITIRAGMILALGLFTGCSDQSSNINQLNQNEFALRGMIASDRQQIDALRADLHRTQDELAEMKHGGVANPSAESAPADVNDRIAKLESEVNALQVALPGAPPPVAGAETPGAPPGAPPSTISPPPVPGVAAITPPAPGGTAPGATAPGGTTGTEPAPTWPQDLDKEIADTENSKEPGREDLSQGSRCDEGGKLSDRDHQLRQGPA